MERRINTDIQSLRIIYNRNKYFIVPGIVVSVCIALIVLVIIPQIKSLFEVKEEALNASRKLAQVRKELKDLSSLDVGILESQLRTSTIALPINKDFGGVINAVYSAAAKTGVRLGQFSFTVGDLSEDEQKDAKSASISLTVALDNDIGTVNSFITEIQRTVPISGIDFVTTDNKISSVGLLFYYKVLPPSDTFKNLAITPLSQDKLSLLGKINNFNNAMPIDLQSQPSTSSSVRSTNPFGE